MAEMVLGAIGAEVLAWTTACAAECWGEALGSQKMVGI